MRASVIEAKRDISEKHKNLLFGHPVMSNKGGFPFNIINEASPNQEGGGDRTARAIEALEMFQDRLKAGEIKFNNGKYAWLDKFIIGYDNKYKSAWDVIMMLLVIYSSITSAYLLAFDIDTGITSI